MQIKALTALQVREEYLSKEYLFLQGKIERLQRDINRAKDNELNELFGD